MNTKPRIRIPLWIIWCAVVILSAGDYIVFFTGLAKTGTIRMLFITALIAMGACWVYLTLRLFRFYIRLRLFFRKLLANDYSTGIRDITWVHDEISELTDLTNRTADQLRTYDELRGERTGLSYRAMDLMFRNYEHGVIFADMSKKTFRFNPSAQDLYGVSQDSYSFETIEKQQANVRFFRIFLLTTLRDGITREDCAVLQLPQRETARELTFRIEPMKDNSEKVRYAFIFITKST